MLPPQVSVGTTLWHRSHSSPAAGLLPFCRHFVPILNLGVGAPFNEFAHSLPDVLSVPFTFGDGMRGKSNPSRLSSYRN